MASDNTIDTLNDLIETSKDGEYGFRACAEQVKSESLRQMLLQRAEECRTAAAELQGVVRSLGGSADDSGSATGALHRGWVAVKGTLAGYDEAAILAETERGEDNALARYRAALNENLPPQVRQIVERQCQGVQRNHDQIKALRDQARMAKTTGTTGTAGTGGTTGGSSSSSY